MNIRSLFDQLHPPACILCQGRNGPICPDCHKDLPWLPGTGCPICALPAPTNDTCGHCLKQPPSFSHASALFSYEFPVNRLIQQLKYQEQLALAATLGGLIAKKLKFTPDVWLPMPLHANRLRERGFNQAVEVARELACLSGIPMQARLATRNRDTPSQAGLKRDARHKNVRDAFSCTASVSGQHVGIVDDVMTTGSTLDALAKSLKNAGASKVTCLVVARAV